MSIETRMGPDAATKAPARSPVEGVKESSRQLRGTIALELARDVDHFGEADKQLLKFHGTYQQEDRDARKARKKDGIGKHYMFMVRCKIPGGRLTAAQYLAVDDLAGKYGNGTLRFTSRQGIQLHGVLKSGLQETIAGINACLLSTFGACGDVERNVMACPAPHYQDAVHEQLQETARQIAAHLAPRTSAYHEIWLNGKPVENGAPVPDLEPLYGKVYLPRKFKTGFALPEDNCVDIYAQDLGFLAIVREGEIVGYNVMVGGGMGMTHGNADTFPHLGRPICYVPAPSVLGAAEAVVKLFRDHGNRANRRRARIKYLVHDWGVDRFRDVLAGYVGGGLYMPKEVRVSGLDLHLGWHPQGNGQWYYGLSVENGRVKDQGHFRLRSGLRSLLECFQPEIRLTPMQDILLCGLEDSARASIEKTLDEHGILPPEQLSNMRKHSMACPAIPTCGLAISESERALPGILNELEDELERLGLGDEPIGVRMTGCPNGCVRPYQSDIGIVGRSGDKFTLFVGGHPLGHRLNFQLKDLVHRDEIVPTLTPILEQYKEDRTPGEGFGDFCQRMGLLKLQTMLLPAAEGYTSEEEAPAEPAPSPAVTVNGSASEPTPVAAPKAEAKPALEPPETRAVEVQLAKPTVAAPVVPVRSELTPTVVIEAPKPAAVVEPKPEPEPKPAVPPAKRSETFLVGPAGEEREDFSYRLNSDGSVRETVVYFYGDDLRASQASGFDPLRREAVYAGRVDASRLFAARKLSDMLFVGDAGHERRDLR
ncbi:MAG TPA: NADPH-dependent assimilatory sulfite reductase hemoprotein subunit, partial [Gemmataceae bacterium]|nr:NADPH-dependent assimilatory sulfite reductase hemoprotein subunit [Gemmataceae bacterium]